MVLSAFARLGRTAARKAKRTGAADELADAGLGRTVDQIRHGAPESARQYDEIGESYLPENVAILRPTRSSRQVERGDAPGTWGEFEGRVVGVREPDQFAAVSGRMEGQLHTTGRIEPTDRVVPFAELGFRRKEVREAQDALEHAQRTGEWEVYTDRVDEVVGGLDWMKPQRWLDETLSAPATTAPRVRDFDVASAENIGWDRLRAVGAMLLSKASPPGDEAAAQTIVDVGQTAKSSTGVGIGAAGGGSAVLAAYAQGRKPEDDGRY